MKWRSPAACLHCDAVVCLGQHPRFCLHGSAQAFVEQSMPVTVQSNRVLYCSSTFSVNQEQKCLNGSAQVFVEQSMPVIAHYKTLGKALSKFSAMQC